MTVEITAERNKRIKTLEAQRADDAATIKGLVKRIAELEREALTALEAREPVVHPDTERLDWLLRVYHLDREAIDDKRVFAQEVR